MTNDQAIADHMRTTHCLGKNPTAHPEGVTGAALAQSLADLPWLAARLAKGQQFNAYQDARDPERWLIGIGPITDFAALPISVPWHVANLLCDALRHAAGQQPALCRAFEDCDDE